MNLPAVIGRLIDRGADEELIRELIESYLGHGGLEGQELLRKLEERGQ